MKKTLLIATLITLSSCSSTSTIKQLQTEYDNYKYSAYVSDSLKERSPVVQAKLSPNDKQLAAVKRQLTSRKRQASGQLNGAINQNGLYKPSRSLQQQLASVGTENQSESWLKNHSSLDTVLALVLKNNLDIKSSREQAQASLAKYDQVGYLDDMLAQYAAFTKDIKLTGSTQKHKKSASAGFPFPGLLALKSSIIDQSVDAARLSLKQTVQDVITKTRVAYYELQFAQQEIAITAQNIKLLKSLKEELKSSYSTNSAGLSGILKVDIEIANNRNILQVTKDRKRAKQARLNAVLNLSPEFTLGKLDMLKTVKLNKNTQQLVKTGKAHRVEIERIRTDLEKMKRIIQLSEKRFYPDFNAGYSRFQNNQFSNKPKVRKSNFFGKNDAYLSETKLKYKALQSKTVALENQTADEIQQAVSGYQTQKRTHALYRNKIIPKARSTLDINKNLYETGEASLLKVLEAQKMILNYKLKSVKALKGMNVNAAKVRRLTGF